MKHLCLVMMIFLTSFAFGNTYIVLNKSVNQSEAGHDNLKKIYLGRKLFWSSKKRIRPAHGPLENSGSKIFLKKILGMTPEEFLAYWRRKLFSGNGRPPQSFETNKDLIEYIKTTPHSIGFTDSKVSDPGLISIPL